MDDMKDSYRVLIVDDHREMRTAFKANLEAINGELQVVDVPSGEEALLEAASGPVDLLIADIGLPGLSGIELFERLKADDPEIRIILVTGQEDEDIRRRIADSEADAFFIKPINIPDFLGTVYRCLGLENPEEAGSELSLLEHDPLHEQITERIQDLRGEVGAISVSVLSKDGKIAAQDGTMPDAVYESKVMPRLLDTFQAVNEISGFLGIENPDSSWYFSGIKYDLFWVHVNPSYGMLVITNPIMQNTDLTWVITTVDMAANDTLKIIREIPPSELKSEPSPESAVQSTGEEKPGESLAPTRGKEEQEDREERLEPLPPSQFAKKFTEVVGKDVDEYWEEVTLKEEVSNFENSDQLSYEEARKLGFISDGE